MTPARVDLRGAPFHLDEEAIAWVEETLASLDERERVGQLFTLISYTGDEAALADLVERTAPGGVMFRPLPVAEIRAGVEALRRVSRVPVVIAANLEKGGDGAAREGTHVGNPLQIAATANAANASRLGTVCGREGAAAGVTWAFAPIVDVDLNFRNPITNTRTFGADPGTVRDMGLAYINALHAEGLAAAPKHFPGDGVDERDQHLVTSTNDLSCEEWDRTFGDIYRACIAADVTSIMVGHIMAPAWSRRLRPGIGDRDILPASLAPEILNDLLRDRLGFNGLIVSDASTMAGMAARLPRSAMVPASIAAGCDMFLFARNLEEDVAFMRAGIEDGVITAERLDDALTRILAFKASLGLHRGAGAPRALDDDTVALHRAWARDVADQAITLVKHTEPILPLDPVRHRRVLLHDLHGGRGFFDSADRGADRLLADLLTAEGFEVTRFESTATMEGDFSPTSDTTENVDLILYLARLATRSNQTTVRIEWAQPMGVDVPLFVGSVPTLFVSVENPYHLLDVPQVPAYINTYDSGEATIRALVDKLVGRAPFTGVDPVDSFCGRWDTRV